jgi:hypothetical protein
MVGEECRRSGRSLGSLTGIGLNSVFNNRIALPLASAYQVCDGLEGVPIPLRAWYEE